MITFNDIERIFAFNLNQKYCIEINFSIMNNAKFNNCWMGKLPDKETKKDVYWVGLTTDGGNASDFECFTEMCEAKVFDGICLREIWTDVEIYSIDGCDPSERIDVYTAEEPST